jgi:DNA-binding response OmpR family regulator
LRARFHAAAGRLVRVFEQLGGKLAARPGASEVMAAVQRELTRLEGTAARCGYREIAALTIALEARVDRWLNDGRADSAERGPAVLHFAAELRTLIGQDPSHGEAAEHVRQDATPVPRAAAFARALAALDDVEHALRADVHLEPIVLVLEPNAVRFRAIQRTLAQVPVSVVNVRTPAQLDAALARHRPMVVWLNIKSNRDPLLEQISAIRERDPHRLTAIVTCAASKEASTRRAVFAAGADEFLLTPLEPTEVHARVTARVERRRLQRIASSLHPVTALALPDRAGREANSALAAALRQGLPCTLALIRLGSGDATNANGTWDHEAVRLAAALGKDAKIVGYDDPVTLLALLEQEPAACVTILDGLHVSRDLHAPDWHAAVVGARDLGARDVATLRTTAAEVLAASRRTTDSAIVVWSPTLAGVTPDVIVVEDDTTLRDMLDFALRERGISHLMFADGAAALDALLVLHPARKRPIVLLDVDLPGIDGHSLFEELRVQRPGAFDFVFVTVRAGEADQVRALSAGALDYVRKPLNVRLMMTKIEHWLTRGSHSL